MIEEDGYEWSPGAEEAFRKIMSRTRCEGCHTEDPPVLSLDGFCEDCLHKQGRALCCLEGDCKGTPE